MERNALCLTIGTVPGVSFSKQYLEFYCHNVPLCSHFFLHFKMGALICHSQSLCFPATQCNCDKSLGAVMLGVSWR